MPLLNTATKVYAGAVPAAKVYQGASLVWSAEWTPAAIPGLGLWLEADKITGLADGAAVTMWPDASGKGRNAVPLATPPSWRQAGVNGKPSVRFTGSPITHMKVQGWGTALSGKTGYTMFQVLTTSEVASYPVITSAPTDSAWTFLTELGTAGVVYWGHPAQYMNTYPANIPLDKPVVLTYALGGGVPKFYKDGALIAGTGNLWPEVGQLGADVLLGGYYNATLGLTGHVAAMIWYDRALTDVERAQVEDYLRGKYIPWTPAAIPGLGAWFDPAQDMFVEGERITSYTEHSPDQRVFAGHSPGAEPVFHAGAAPYIEFQGGGHFQYDTWNAGPVGLTFVAVNSLTTPAQPMMLIAHHSSNDGYEMRWDSMNMQTAASWQTAFNYHIHTVADQQDVKQLHMWRHDVSRQTSDAWVGPVRESFGAAVMPNVPSWLFLGVRYGGYWYTGKVYEALVFAGAVSDADLAKLADYLNAKHGITRSYW